MQRSGRRQWGSAESESVSCLWNRQLSRWIEASVVVIGYLPRQPLRGCVPLANFSRIPGCGGSIGNDLQAFLNEAPFLSCYRDYFQHCAVHGFSAFRLCRFRSLQPATTFSCITQPIKCVDFFSGYRVDLVFFHQGPWHHTPAVEGLKPWRPTLENVGHGQQSASRQSWILAGNASAQIRRRELA